VTDHATGVRFELPGVPHIVRGSIGLPSGSRGQVREYSVDLGPRAGPYQLLALTVDVFSGLGGTTLPLTAFADTLTASLRKEHAQHLVLSNKRAASVSGHQSLDYDVNYQFNATPLGGWLIESRAVDDGRAYVVLEVKIFQPAFGPDTISSAALKHLRARLLAGLRV
jgi:hypothetical protein